MIGQNKHVENDSQSLITNHESQLFHHVGHLDSGERGVGALVSLLRPGALYGLLAINRLLTAEELILAEGWAAARGGAGQAKVQ